MSASSLPPTRRIKFRISNGDAAGYVKAVPAVGPDREVSAALFEEAEAVLAAATDAKHKDGCSRTMKLDPDMIDYDTDTFEFGIFPIACDCKEVTLIAAPLDE